jgi:hypothetical protein
MNEKQNKTDTKESRLLCKLCIRKTNLVSFFLTVAETIQKTTRGNGTPRSREKSMRGGQMK